MISQRAPAADPAEVAKFDALAARWWDPAGPMGPLHGMNPLRIGLLRDAFAPLAGGLAPATGRDPQGPRPLEGLHLLDVGCGAGLASEPLARLGASVTGLDASEAAIEAARAHAAGEGLAIDYRLGTVEALGAAGERFDGVITLEVIEHVPDPGAFVRALAGVARPGGLVAVSTINRTLRAYALAILGAERVLGWLPRGTHDWHRFVTPSELDAAFRVAGLRPRGRHGMVFDPLGGRWRVSRDASVNYLATAARSASA